MTLAVVIGPPAGGKSTTAALLAHRLGLELVCFDEDRPRWYGGSGYSDEAADAVYARGGLRAWRAYTARHDVRALERAAAGAGDVVIDTGGGVTLQVRESEEERMLHRALDAADIAVLACPHPDDAELAYAEVARRLSEREPDGDWRTADGAALLRDLVASSLALRHRVRLLVDTASGQIHEQHRQPSTVKEEE